MGEKISRQIEQNKRKFLAWKFDKKMCTLFAVAITLSTVLIVGLSLTFSIRSIVSSSKRLVEEKVETLVNSTESNFNQYQGVLWSLMLDTDVQAYLEDSEEYGHYLYMQRALENAFIMWDNMNFIGIISADGEKSYVKGNSVPYSEIGLQQRIMEDVNNSYRIARRSTSMRTMTYNTSFNRTNKYALMIYQPVYSTSQLDDRIGLLYMNLNDADLEQIISGKRSEMNTNDYFLYDDGTVIASSEISTMGTKMDISSMTGSKGSYWKSGNLYIYQQLKEWNYRYVTSIGLYDMCRQNIFSIVILIIFVLCLMAAVLKIASKIIHQAYRPWGNVADTIETVSAGHLEARLDGSSPDPDMERITEGFNSMMETILTLMDQVKEEQKQADQIRFNALQSQIQPHFLYNTLDCIHWQAVIDGNNEISSMVKALAAYYRTCLSKGRDIISLEEELNHIRNYLYIQQMRYGDVLTYEIIGPREIENVQIPKLTLQPLVENSIYHGIKVKAGKQGHVEIVVTREDQAVLIAVCDSGEGMTQEQIDHMNRHIDEYDETMGYGVRNVNRRIELLYGPEYGLYYMKNQSGGITVEVRIPNDKTQKEDGENHV